MTFPCINSGRVLVCEVLGNFPSVIWKCPTPISGEQGRQKEAGHSRLVGGRFIKQGNLHRGLFLGHHERQIDLHIPLATLKCRCCNYLHPHTPSRWSQCHITILRLWPWSSLWGWEIKQNSHSKDSGGDEDPLIVEVQLLGQLWSCPLCDFAQHGVHKFISFCKAHLSSIPKNF